MIFLPRQQCPQPHCSFTERESGGGDESAARRIEASPTLLSRDGCVDLAASLWQRKEGGAAREESKLGTIIPSLALLGTGLVGSTWRSQCYRAVSAKCAEGARCNETSACRGAWVGNIAEQGAPQLHAEAERGPHSEHSRLGAHNT